MYGSETLSLTLREEHGLRVFENRVLRRILELRGTKLQETEEDCIVRSFKTCTLHQTLLEDQIREDEMGGECTMYGRDDKCI
jgi:hypothetical protein